ncbi:MAG: PBECR2 nuclease fold domain-containing protein [bacterium]
MRIYRDVHNRKVKFSDERREHAETEHPEMKGQINKIRETLLKPEKIVRSKTDSQVELFYRYYRATPVTQKYSCVVVKVSIRDLFIITAYFTDTIKKGEVLWERN